MAHFKPTTEASDGDGHYAIKCEGGALPYVIIRNRDKIELPGRHATRDAAHIARSRLYPNSA